MSIQRLKFFSCYKNVNQNWTHDGIQEFSGSVRYFMKSTNNMVRQKLPSYAFFSPHWPLSPPLAFSAKLCLLAWAFSMILVLLVPLKADSYTCTNQQSKGSDWDSTKVMRQKKVSQAWILDWCTKMHWECFHMMSTVFFLSLLLMFSHLLFMEISKFVEIYHACNLHSRKA